MTLTDFPSISVRIPAYNHEKYVRDCLDSILNTGYPNLEVVIVNDGSVDGTSNQISAWIEEFSSLIPVKFSDRLVNKGIAYTLNELNSMCEGQYIVGLASDDVLTKTSLHSRADYLTRNPEKFAVIGDALVIDELDEELNLNSDQTSICSSLNSLNDDEGLRAEVLFNWCIAGSVLMVRRNVLDEGYHYDESLQIEDWDFYIRLVLDRKLGYLSEPVSFYRIHDANTSSDPNKRFAQLSSLVETTKRYRNRLSISENIRMDWKLFKLKVAYGYERLKCAQF